jgi:tetratricopeptide (TPR) repeat protein
MDRQQIDQLHEKASEHYLRGEFRDALEAWESLLTIDPGDEQAMEGVRLAALLADGTEPPAPPAPPLPSIDPADLQKRLDEVDAHIEAGDLKGAVDVAERLAAELPFDPAAIEARDRARRALETEPFLEEQLARAKAELVAGRAGAAALACRSILSIDPQHFEAASLLRRCEGAPEGGDPLDEGLKVLDTLAIRLDGAKQVVEAFPRPRPAAEPPVTMAPPAPVAPPAHATAAASDAKGPGPLSPPTQSAAADELRRRVDDLLAEARREAAADRIDEALGILSRVFILDEQNQKALTLEQDLRTAQGKSSRDADAWLQEAVQDFEAGRIEEARDLFLKVLRRYPGHLEAVDYLERIDSAEARKEEGAAAAGYKPVFRGEDLLAGGEAPSGPRTMTAEPGTCAIPLERGTGQAENAPQADHAGPWTLEESGIVGRAPAAPAVAASTPFSLPWPLVGGLAAVVVVAAIAGIAWQVPKLFHARSAHTVPAAQLGAPAAPGPARRPAAAAPDTVYPPAAKSAPEAMARAKAAMDSGAYAAAVIAYNEALTLDPSLEEARAGLMQAGDRYKVQKADRDQIDRAKIAFEEGEYTPTLKILYRLPEGRYAAEVERYKVNAWYNLGLVSLRAGNCKEAQESFDEALGLRPGETDIRRAKGLAQKYQAAAKDRAFYDAAEAIPFRRINE